MKIGIVGYQGSGKSTLFEWLTGTAPDHARAHTTQSAMAPIPDPRIDALREIYHPKKITLAALELVDTPGLDRSHEGSAARLAQIREVGSLVVVIAAYLGGDPAADLTSLDEDLLLTDLDLISRRIARLEESIKKPRPTRDQERAELEALRPMLAAMEAGRRACELELTDEQMRATRGFQLLTDKPALVVVNTADDDTDLHRFAGLSTPQRPVIAVPLGLELELARMDAADRAELVEEMELSLYDRDGLLRKILEASGQITFFTAGEKEVRSWLLHRGATAVEAADQIHSDLARGFIRAETISCADLIRLGSEREVKAKNLVRQEPKDYVVIDDDVLNIRFSV
jgi:hypothetical protein